tara:strand:+ start:175546 stop:176928 length:1383 start_codon:yes stop_codon:yes gene_type:complete
MNLEQLLTSGGDERIDLQKNGFNKYNLNPVKYEGILTRGSCTGSPLNQESHQHLIAFSKEYQAEKHDEYCEEVRNNLKELIQEGDDNFDVFLSPSGSDLCYLPLLFAKLLHPNKDVTNYVTCPEELGTGSVLTLAGKIFSERSQFDEKLVKGSPISDDIHVNHHFFSARNGEGELEQYKGELIEQMNAEDGKSTVIGNLVIGSKSGIADNINIISKVKKASFWVADICQLRTPTKLINKLIDQNCMILITGSKFYQAPPFCGALLVPKTITKELQNADENILTPFKKFFSYSDIPSTLPWLKNHFKKHNNLGLLLRWKAALYEMNQLNKIDPTDVINTVETWNKSVLDELAKYPDLFELMPQASTSNPSIIPFRLKRRDGNYISDEQLKDFYDYIIAKDLSGFEGPYKKVALGQPVKYSGISFIRMALGSYNIRQILSGKHSLKDDLTLVQIIAEEARNF